MTRAEHLAWCKCRALEYVDQGDLASAVTSMLSDLSKHPDTASNNPFLAALALTYVTSGDVSGVRRWINGFN
jgi:hypothetical protein